MASTPASPWRHLSCQLRGHTVFNFSAPQQHLAREPAALSWSSFCFWSLSCRLSRPVPSVVPEAWLRPQPAPPLLTFLGVSAALGAGPHTYRPPPSLMLHLPHSPSNPKSSAHSPRSRQPAQKHKCPPHLPASPGSAATLVQASTPSRWADASGSCLGSCPQGTLPSAATGTLECSHEILPHRRPRPQPRMTSVLP